MLENEYFLQRKPVEPKHVIPISTFKTGMQS